MKIRGAFVLRHVGILFFCFLTPLPYVDGLINQNAAFTKLQYFPQEIGFSKRQTRVTKTALADVAAPGNQNRDGQMLPADVKTPHSQKRFVHYYVGRYLLLP